MVVDLGRVIGGERVSRGDLLEAPIRWPRPSHLLEPLPAGSSIREAASRMGINDLRGLLEHVPTAHQVRSNRSLGELRVGEEATVEVEIRSISLRPTRRRNLRIVEALVSDGSGTVKAVWFNQQWLAKQLEPGMRLRIFGKFKSGALQVREHERIDHVAAGPTPEDQEISVYPGTEGLSSARIRQIVESVRGFELDTIEPLPARMRAREKLMTRADALAEMHFPRPEGSPEAGRTRLAFEELLLHQLALIQRRRSRSDGFSSQILTPHGTLIDPWRERLPFQMTTDQSKAMAEIDSDLGRSIPMQRLLMGEVGSGKTVVALAAMLRAAENGAQAAMMAPTETLAEQHFSTLDAMLPEVPLALLTGSTPVARRREILARLAAGELPLVVGTHALIEEPVVFRNLALVVVDEQHRFGVRQRAALDAKAPAGMLPHVLHMTATPIPRTLSLVNWGDIDVTQIRELPRGRRPIGTRVVGDGQRAEAYDLVRAELRAGRQAYVVCPLVSESEQLQAKAATVEAEKLALGELKDFSVGLIHGQMSAAEKAGAMDGFAAGEIDVLVATSVIEVGVDVPNASVMIVEDAARYGISQLHQLRGRVGRGEHDSVCLLFGEPASRRLRVVAAESDGFELARVDLELRGSGEELGTRQSGLPRFRFAVLPEDEALLERAASAAELLIGEDEALEAPEYALLRDAVTGLHGAAIDPIPA